MHVVNQIINVLLRNFIIKALTGNHPAVLHAFDVLSGNTHDNLTNIHIALSAAMETAVLIEETVCSIFTLPRFTPSDSVLPHRESPPSQTHSYDQQGLSWCLYLYQGPLPALKTNPVFWFFVFQFYRGTNYNPRWFKFITVYLFRSMCPTYLAPGKTVSTYWTDCNIVCVAKKQFCGCQKRERFQFAFTVHIYLVNECDEFRIAADIAHNLINIVEYTLPHRTLLFLLNCALPEADIGGRMVQVFRRWPQWHVLNSCRSVASVCFANQCNSFLHFYWWSPTTGFRCVISISLPRSCFPTPLHFQPQGERWGNFSSSGILMFLSWLEIIISFRSSKFLYIGLGEKAFSSTLRMAISKLLHWCFPVCRNKAKWRNKLLLLQ